MNIINKFTNILIWIFKNFLWFSFAVVLGGVIMLYLISEHKMNFSDNVALIAVFLVIIQIAIAQLYNIKNNERARKEKLHDVISHWIDNYVKYVQAREIVENIEDKLSLKNLQNRKGGEIKISIAYEYDLFDVLEVDNNIYTNSQNTIIKNTDFIIIKDGFSRKLREQAIAYLNTLETIFIFWKNGAVEKEILKQQFKVLFEKHNHAYTLKNFRESLGGKDYFPNITLFEKSL